MPLFDVYWDEASTFCVTVEADDILEAHDHAFDRDWWCQDEPYVESAGWVVPDSVDIVEVVRDVRV